MHELSIADAIVRIACENARGRRVARVEVKIGHLRQVVPSALEFSFQLVADGTVARGAELAIEEVPIEVDCRTCGEVTRQEAFPLLCGACGAFNVEVVRGEELLVESIELDDEGEMATVGASWEGGSADDS